MTDADLDEPYENTLSIEQLRREVRHLWDTQNALVKALRNRSDVPPYDVLMLLSRAATWPSDNSIGKRLQRELGSAVVPYKSEAEGGAGLWHRIVDGLKSSDEPSASSSAGSSETSPSPPGLLKA